MGMALAAALWLYWEQSPRGGWETPTLTQRPPATREACLTVAAEQAENDRPQALSVEPVRSRAGEGFRVVLQATPPARVHYMCYPANVDPRSDPPPP
jgi:hypothetical protein